MRGAWADGHSVGAGRRAIDLGDGRPPANERSGGAAARIGAGTQPAWRWRTAGSRRRCSSRSWNGGPSRPTISGVELPRHREHGFGGDQRHGLSPRSDNSCLASFVPTGYTTELPGRLIVRLVVDREGFSSSQRAALRFRAPALSAAPQRPGPGNASAPARGRLLGGADSSDR